MFSLIHTFYTFTTTRLSSGNNDEWTNVNHLLLVSIFAVQMTTTTRVIDKFCRLYEFFALYAWYNINVSLLPLLLHLPFFTFFFIIKDAVLLVSYVIFIFLHDDDENANNANNASNGTLHSKPCSLRFFSSSSHLLGVFEVLHSVLLKGIYICVWQDREECTIFTVL